MNGETGKPGERIASTSNRNFVGRQGKGVRTHLVSPAMAAAAAVTGTLHRRAPSCSAELRASNHGSPSPHCNAVAVPLDQPNIDTDQIIPARFLGKLTREQQVERLFHDLRCHDDGRRKPASSLNKPAYTGAEIIVAERNFACGSARENAVTVMVDNGFRAFIAPSFGDIFFNNCFQNGALPIRAARGARPRDAAPSCSSCPAPRSASISPSQTVTGPDGKTDSFEIDPFRKDCLLKGRTTSPSLSPTKKTSPPSKPAKKPRWPGCSPHLEAPARGVGTASPHPRCHPRACREDPWRRDVRTIVATTLKRSDTNNRYAC